MKVWVVTGEHYYDSDPAYYATKCEKVFETKEKAIAWIRGLKVYDFMLMENGDCLPIMYISDIQLEENRDIMRVYIHLNDGDWCDAIVKLELEEKEVE